jgi:holo-[acyl-carrier protein] synthase
VILGVGIDLVEVPRMQRVLDRPWGRRFIERVFCPEEIAVSEGAARPSEAYAARFAAKEAVVKALGTGFSKGITPAAIVVCGGERTRPTIRFQAKALALAESLDVSDVHVSLTHTAGAACAVAVIEKK